MHKQRRKNNNNPYGSNIKQKQILLKVFSFNFSIGHETWHLRKRFSSRYEPAKPTTASLPIHFLTPIKPLKHMSSSIPTGLASEIWQRQRQSFGTNMPKRSQSVTVWHWRLPTLLVIAGPVLIRHTSQISEMTTLRRGVWLACLFAAEWYYTQSLYVHN